MGSSVCIANKLNNVMDAPSNRPFDINHRIDDFPKQMAIRQLY